MIEYRITKINDSILKKIGKENRELCAIDNSKMYFKRLIKKTTKRKPKEQIEEKLYYSESLVKGLCSYYKDIEHLYKDWREQRKSTGAFKPFTERSEKITWNKINKHPKAVVIEMLNNAIAGSWGRLIDLESYEVEKIMQPLRDEKRKEELKLEGFGNEKEKQKAEETKRELNNYINLHPEIIKEATEFIEKNNPKAEGKFKNTLINGKARIIANTLINNI